LTEKNKGLELENKRLNDEIQSLRRELKQHKSSLQKMDQVQSKISDRVKDKIERLLEKIDKYDKNHP
jgi:hypothetical protein